MTLFANKYKMNKIIEMTNKMLGIFFVPLHSIFSYKKAQYKSLTNSQIIFLKCVNI